MEAPHIAIRMRERFPIDGRQPKTRKRAIHSIGAME
jgi:hypothetical protein